MLNKQTRYKIEKLTYTDVKNNIFARGLIPDGYCGGIIDVGFYYHNESGKTIVVTPTGFFKAAIPTAINVKEATWLLINHPSSNVKNVTTNLKEKTKMNIQFTKITFSLPEWFAPERFYYWTKDHRMANKMDDSFFKRFDSLRLCEWSGFPEYFAIFSIDSLSEVAKIQKELIEFFKQYKESKGDQNHERQNNTK